MKVQVGDVIKNSSVPREYCGKHNPLYHVLVIKVGPTYVDCLRYDGEISQLLKKEIDNYEVIDHFDLTGALYKTFIPLYIKEEKCDYGYYTDLTKLPVGTTFYVKNGAWCGKITGTEKDKRLYVDATEMEWKITGKEELVLTNICIPKDKVTDKLMCDSDYFRILDDKDKEDDIDDIYER